MSNIEILRTLEQQKVAEEAAILAGYRQSRKHADRWLDRALVEPDAERVVAMAAHWWTISEAQRKRVERIE